MTSTIRVDNFGPSAGGTTYSARGIAKAWVNFNGTGTIAARDSENVSSLTDNGVGNYAVNLTNAMANANGPVTSSDYQAALGNLIGYYSSPSIITAGSYDNSGANTDYQAVQLIGMGDLA